MSINKRNKEKKEYILDIVSKMLAEKLEVDDEVNKKPAQQATGEINPLTNQPVYSSSLVTEADIAAYEAVESGIGIEVFSKIVLMKTAQKAMADHDELIETMAKVDDKLAARMSEVAVSALSSSADAAKALMNFSMAKEKLEIEKSKLEIKSVTINNLGGAGGEAITSGSQKDILDQLKNVLNDEGDATDDPPPLVDV